MSYSQTITEYTVNKIVFIRHGEKPESGDNLSCKGLNRALQLPAVLQDKVGTIEHLFVPALKLGATTNHSRMFQTISPYAIQHNLSINTAFDEVDSNGISNTIKSLQGTALLVWEHKNILNIVKELGVVEDIMWDDNDYNSIWIVTFQNGVAVLNRDSENLNPDDKCN